MGPPAHGGGREEVTWGRRGARDGEEGEGEGKDGEEAHSIHISQYLPRGQTHVQYKGHMFLL